MATKQGDVQPAQSRQIGMQGKFNIKKASYDVILQEDIIKWRNCSNPKEGFTVVRLENVFCAASPSGTDKEVPAQQSTMPSFDPAGESVSASQVSSQTKTKQTSSVFPQFTLHYISKMPNHAWKHNTITFMAPASATPEDIDPWIAHIKGYCNCLNRPKRLLVFINPASGGGTGVKIYHKAAAPIFEHADIATEVIITDNAKHVGQVLDEYDLSSLDGIISVGGDGTFLQCFNGLLWRLAKDAEKDLNDPREDPVAPSIPIGIIPAGTSNLMIKDATLCADPVTAALYIVCGEQYKVNMFSVYNAGKFISFGSVLVGYGFLGDVISYSESKRNLFGRARYMVAYAKVLTKPRVFEAEMYYKPMPESRIVPESCSGKGEWGFPDTSAVAGNVDCAPSPENVATMPKGWDLLKGSYSGVIMMKPTLGPLTLEKRFKQSKIEPPDPDVMTMGIYHMLNTCSRVKMMKCIVGLLNGNEALFHNEYIKRTKVQEFKMVVLVEELNESNNCLNIDGEPYRLEDKTVHVKGHANLLPMFGAESGIVPSVGSSGTTAHELKPKAAETVEEESCREKAERGFPDTSAAAGSVDSILAPENVVTIPRAGNYCKGHIQVRVPTLGPLTLEKRFKQSKIVPPDPDVMTMNIYYLLNTCSRVKITKCIVGLLDGNEALFHNDYIKRTKVLEFKMVVQVEELNESNNCLNIDGEAYRLKDETVHVRGHANLLPMFGAGLWNILDAYGRK